MERPWIFYPIDSKQQMVSLETRAVNESSFVEWWMFKLGLTTKVKRSSSALAQTKPINNVQAQLAKDLKKGLSLTWF